MADEPVPSQTALWSTKLWAAGIGAGFAIGVIIYLLFFGAKDNRLHESAMTWAWVTILGVLAGFGVGAVIGPITDIWKR